MTTSPPIEATIFSYQVKFGDCFLIRFSYADGSRRHMLIDFGTTSLLGNAALIFLRSIAEDIKLKCNEQAGDKLDIVVATHRHADHIAGFTTDDNKQGPGDIIASLKPDIVLQPWTEDPKAPLDSLGPAQLVGKKGVAYHLNSLNAMHAISTQVVKMLDSGNLPNMPKGLQDQIRFIGEDNIKNVLAVKNLMKMGKTNVYAYHGSDAGLDTILPGVSTTVLGPPTLRQTQEIRKQRTTDPDQFWQLSAKRMQAVLPHGTGKGIARSKLFPSAKVRKGNRALMEHRWLADRIDEANGEMLLGIVTALDKQMNNTSLILLFKAGSKTLLFPGDAQIENWEYALHSEFAPLLDDVDLYKVGHHGSRNATPREMWNRFKKRGNDKKADRMTSIMSTAHGKHGSETNNSEVPRKTLVAELKQHSHLYSTEWLPQGKLCEEIVIDLR